MISSVRSRSNQAASTLGSNWACLGLGASLDLWALLLFLTWAPGRPDLHLVAALAGFRFYYEYLIPLGRWRRISLLLAAMGLRGAIFASAVPAEWLVGVFGVACSSGVIAAGRALLLDARDLSAPGLVELAVLYLLLVRVLYLGAFNLVAEETYYWQYSQHPALGYLDHPPMVGWLIYIGERLFGHAEIGVRSGALACWCLAARYMYRLASDLSGRESARMSLLLMSIFPYCVGAGSIMSPDAPLLAAWCACLYYAQRALFTPDGASQWWKVGAAIGLGMLSKYTIALLGIAIVLVVIVDPAQRRWLRRREPYVAAAIALLLFAPVLAWNAGNGWASFLFQGSRRMNSSAHFSLHKMLWYALQLVTPPGLIAAAVALRGEMRAGRSRAIFVSLCFLVPLSAFTVYSLGRVPKLNWVGPPFLALVPAIGALICSRGGPKALRRAWLPTFGVLGPAYAIAFHYLTIGIPFAPFSHKMYRVIGWSDLAAEVAEIARRSDESPGRPAIVVGMDKHNVSSELAFYLAGEGLEVEGRALFGMPSLMYQFWTDPGEARGRNVLMVGRRAEDLEDPRLGAFFRELEPVRSLEVAHAGLDSVTYYVRMGRSFVPRGSAEARP